MFPAEWLEFEYFGDDVNNLIDVARSTTGVRSLHEATDGDPSQSIRWQLNAELGADQEVIARLRSPSGEIWGALGLYRAPDEPLFDAADRSYLAALGPHLADGARRSLLVGAATDPEGPESPGLLVLDSHGEIESMTPGVDRWLEELSDHRPSGPLPAAIRAVAAQAARSSGPTRPGDAVVSRVLTSSGTWIVLHATALVTTGDGRVAVILEPATAARIYPLLMSAYGLTARERDVTQLVLQGFSTAEIAAELVVSAHTVQQHLKSIFDKTGVRSRRDLVGKVFFVCYEPRLRDNEHRTAQGMPTRGGPMPGG